MPAETLAWWTLLRSVAALNLLAWGIAAVLLWRRSAAEPALWEARRIHLLLAGGYVLGCAWRSLLPVFDVQRLTFVDGWYGSVLVGRSVATIAELCFVAQWALLLREASDAARWRTGSRIAALLVPMIVVAETCSWTAVLTTSNLGHVLEESLWGVTAGLLLVSLLWLRPQAPPEQRPLLTLCSVAALLYMAYIFTVDVPMYWSRWLSDEAEGRAYLGLAQGFHDVATRWIVSHRWEDWKSEVVWMSLYFSAAVWFSIALTHAPLLHRSRSALRPLARRLSMPNARRAARASKP